MTLRLVVQDAISVRVDQSLDLALLKMGKHAVRQAPVVLAGPPDRVVGMLSLEDISGAISRAHLLSA